MVVLDVRLPGMDGLTAMRGLRDRLGRVPIVVITAFGNLETAVKALEGGAFEYLVKPFDLDQAVTVVERALDQRGGPEPMPARRPKGPRSSSAHRRPCRSCSGTSRWSHRRTSRC